MISTDTERSPGGLQVAFRNTLGKVGAENARRVINVLLESPFFYREDDVDLFGLLRRRQSLFSEFFEVFFGWELFVDRQVARLIKPKTFNPQLKPTQRHVFRIAGRHEYVLFVLLLEFYQLQVSEQNIDVERESEVRFVLADFVEFAFQRYREELAESAPEEALILAEMRALFRKLERHRFIALVETTGIAVDQGLAAGFTREGGSSVLYAMLPGLRCYRPEELNNLRLADQNAEPEDASDSENNGNAGEVFDDSSNGRESDVVGGVGS